MSKIELTPKQSLIFKHFHNPNISEILFGGNVGSGKSFGACVLMIAQCVKYSGIRVLLGRNELSSLKKTTLVSFTEVAGIMGLIEGYHWSINNSTNIITFSNGSEIYLKELKLYPRDPEFQRLQGELITFAVIDEAGEICKKAKDAVFSRCGRWKNAKYGITPQVIMTCNPSDNFLQSQFYKPLMNETLLPYRRFIMTTMYDNEHLPQSYFDNLKRMDIVSRERLLYGNWDFKEDDGSRLTKYDLLEKMYINPIIRPRGIGYLSCDIAFTSDKCVIVRWVDDTIVEIVEVNKDDKPEETILAMTKSHNIKMRNVVYDADGVGKYLRNYLKGAHAFMGNGKVYNKENYQNLKAQIFFKNAEMIKDGIIKIATDHEKEQVLKELYAVRSAPLEVMDGKLKLLPKKVLKKELGHSPDYADAIAYKRIFDYKNTSGVSFI